MKNKLTFLSVLLVVQPLLAFTVAIPHRLLLSGVSSGHEEITRQAMNRIDLSLKLIGIDIDKSFPEFLGDRDVEISGTKGLTTKNFIIKGNYSTDIPGKLLDTYDIPKWHGQALEGWTNNPKVQDLHFLRNVTDDNKLVSAYETCMSAREEIVKSTAEGIRLWNQSLKDNDLSLREKSLFLIGHATHTIQDSFSSAHTKRDDSNHNNDVKNICYYGLKRADEQGACYHLKVDPRDDIWVSNVFDIIRKVVIFPIASDSVKEENIKEEAVLARTATMRYLFLVASTIKNQNEKPGSIQEIRTLLKDRLFEGASGMKAIDQGLAVASDTLPISMPNGVIRCEALKQL
jgi:hypothetical protein